MESEGYELEKSTQSNLDALLTAADRVENPDAKVVCISFFIDLIKHNQLTSLAQTNECAQR